MTPREFLQTVVRPNLEEFNADYGSVRRAHNAVATVEVRADQVAAGDRYVRLQLTGGGNAVTAGAIGLGTEAGHKPANAQDVSNTYLSQRVVVP